MRAAILISGYLRTFKQNISSIKNIILNDFKEVDIYIHITKNENEKDKYLNPSTLYENIKLVQDSLNPVCLLVEEDQSKYNDIQSNNLFNSWLKFYKLNLIKKQNELVNGKYDLVIKYRPDLNISTKNLFNFNIKKNNLYIPSDSKIDKTKLKNITDNYICDSFCFGSSDIMDKYFNLFTNLEKIINKYSNVPENVLYNYLNEYKINYTLLDIDYEIILSKCNIFGICGDSGSGKSTLSNALKTFFSNSFILECDRYHKWERGDKNWSYYTHLNPDANYITKMNEDIFNLKIGNHIYQVDYDHKNGKFTDKEKINPSENMIVCGLHSLYQESEQLYDIKIFMDTERELLKKWKIERDTKERGYSKEKILEQIEKRKNDYEKYILPQKEKSDLIINFFSKDEKICLNLLINKKYDITKILKILSTKKINFSFSSNDEKFLLLSFPKYSSINLWDSDQIPMLYNFYDYIIFVILNLKF